MAGQIPLNRRRSKRSGPDYYPTPPWATRALCLRLKNKFPIARQSVWEPACGAGHMAKPLGEFFKTVRATDLHDYSAKFPACEPGLDFLLNWPGDEITADWIITNPPFVLAEDFLELALDRARIGVAFFVKVQFLEGTKRFRRIFSRRPPAAVFQFSERVPLVSSRLDPQADTNQSYVWIVWLKDATAAAAFRAIVPGPALGWVGQVRAELERPGDYYEPKPADPDAPSLFDEVEQ
jgi:hypothetical protein